MFWVMGISRSGRCSCNYDRYRALAARSGGRSLQTCKQGSLQVLAPSLLPEVLSDGGTQRFFSRECSGGPDLPQPCRKGRGVADEGAGQHAVASDAPRAATGRLFWSLRAGAYEPQAEISEIHHSRGPTWQQWDPVGPSGIIGFLGPPGPLRSFSSAKPDTSRSAVLSRCTQLSAFGVAKQRTKQRMAMAGAFFLSAPRLPFHPLPLGGRVAELLVELGATGLARARAAVNCRLLQACTGNLVNSEAVFQR